MVVFARSLMGIGRVTPVDESKTVNRAVGVEGGEEKPKTLASGTKKSKRLSNAVETLDDRKVLLADFGVSCTGKPIFGQETTVSLPSSMHNMRLEDAGGFVAILCGSAASYLQVF